MKNRVLTFALIALAAMTLVSCASRKYGCPTVSVYSKTTRA